MNNKLLIAIAASAILSTSAFSQAPKISKTTESKLHEIKTPDLDGKKLNFKKVIPNKIASWKSGGVNRAQFMDLLGTEIPKIEAALARLPEEGFPGAIYMLCNDVVNSIIIEEIAVKEGFIKEEGEAREAFLLRWAKSPKDLKKVDDEEVMDFYNRNKESLTSPKQIRVAQIFISLAYNTEAEALERIEKIKAELAKNTPFEKLAREFSDDDSASRGGTLPFFHKGMRPPAFEKEAFALNRNGQTSDFFRTSGGYHILKKTGEKEGVLKPFKEAEPTIKELLENRAITQKVNSKLKNFKASQNYTFHLAKPSIKINTKK